jgi:hypothetical protein
MCVAWGFRSLMLLAVNVIFMLLAVNVSVTDFVLQFRHGF